MAKATCPEGHPTNETDYCDVCGAPIESSAVSSAGAGGSSSGDDERDGGDQDGAPVGLRCPNCQVMNAPDALFCEACGYDYTTGTLPRAAQPSVLELDMEAARADQQAGPADAEASDEAAAPRRTGATAAGNPLDLDSPVAGAAAASAEKQAGSAASAEQGDAPAAAAATDSEAEGASAAHPRAQDSAAGTPAAEDSADKDSIDKDSTDKDSAPADVPGGTSAPGAAAGSDAAAGRTDRVIASTEPIEFEWVAEVWIDPDWYRLQESPDQLPSPGLPEMHPLKSDRILIGRPSRSRNISPDIDCEPDSGTSRRQAELTTDGRNWFIEDLDSANGTFVGQTAGSLPETPIPSGKKHQLDADDRIYVGAWTRLVLRKATEEEKEAFRL